MAQATPTACERTRGFPHDTHIVCYEHRPSESGLVISLIHPTFHGRETDWRLQLNLVIVWGNCDDVPIKSHPDGTIAQIRIPNERRFNVTRTFAF